MSSRSDRSEAAKQNDAATRTDRAAAATDRDAAVTDRSAAATDRGGAATDRKAAQEDRTAAASDRSAAATDRSAASAELEDLKQELAATNVLLLGLSRELQSDRVETAVRVEGLRAEQHRERRIRMMYVAGGGVATIYAYDQHIEHCSPGARVVKGVDWLLTHPAKPGDTPEGRQAQFEEHYDHASILCDITLPLHTHDGSAWPTGGDMVGLALLAALGLAVAVYHRFRTRKDFARVEAVVASEEGSNSVGA